MALPDVGDHHADIGHVVAVGAGTVHSHGMPDDDATGDPGARKIA
jgi:hypothetical protein